MGCTGSVIISVDYLDVALSIVLHEVQKGLFCWLLKDTTLITLVWPTQRLQNIFFPIVENVEVVDCLPSWDNFYVDVRFQQGVKFPPLFYVAQGNQPIPDVVSTPKHRVGIYLALRDLTHLRCAHGVSGCTSYSVCRYTSHTLLRFS